MKLVRLQERLSWLSQLLTQERLEEKINHAQREQLIEESEQVELEIREEISINRGKTHADCY